MTISRTMAGTKFYIPRRIVDFNQKEAMYAHSLAEEFLQKGEAEDTPLFDFVTPKDYLPEMGGRIVKSNIGAETFEPDFFDLGDFQISYNFSGDIRGNRFPMKNILGSKTKILGQYGATGWSYRMLYEYLCREFNNNVLFIDTYFDRVFKSRGVYSKLLSIWDEIKEDIAGEQMDILSNAPYKADGTLDERSRQYRKAFKDFAVWRNPIIKGACKRLADDIRGDIEVCLSTGRIPLRKQQVSSGTRKVRAGFFGLHPDAYFYASGKLVRHVNILVQVGEKAA